MIESQKENMSFQMSFTLVYDILCIQLLLYCVNILLWAIFEVLISFSFVENNGANHINFFWTETKSRDKGLFRAQSKKDKNKSVIIVLYGGRQTFQSMHIMFLMHCRVLDYTSCIWAKKVSRYFRRGRVIDGFYLHVHTTNFCQRET